jgi:hypothetical protein
MRQFGPMVAAALLGVTSGCGTMLNLDGMERLDIAS